MSYTLHQFQTEYATDDACLDRLLLQRYGKKPTCPGCGVIGTKLHRITGRRAYACQWCGHHVYPCAGTPFEKSRTPLTSWFLVMYLHTTGRNGISAKEIERLLGVTYKAAWRMNHQIRELMGEYINIFVCLEGHVELDETYIGGKEKNKHADKRTKGTQGAGSVKSKSILFGALNRDGGVYTEVVPDNSKKTLQPIVKFNTRPKSTISTDELSAYTGLSRIGFKHGVVRHGIHEYVNGKHHVNSLEGFWKHLKGGINGTYISVSKKHLQWYADEFSFRYSTRREPDNMFEKLLSAILPRP